MFSDKVLKIAKRAESDAASFFARVDEIAFKNTARVLGAFQNERIGANHFNPTTGYGYGDDGRDKLDRVFAKAFNAEDALVRYHFVSGTHAIACGLFALLRPGDTLLCACGLPYDTLQPVIGAFGKKVPGSLADFGVKYEQVELDGDYFKNLQDAVIRHRPKVVEVQRSCGYSDQRALSINEIGEMVRCVKEACPDSVVLVDNCYGEFVEEREPTCVGADLICGSLIKNPGGGLALTGGYIAGKAELVELCAARLTVPGIGREAGSNPSGYREMYQGLFFAPHVTAQALKTAVFCARALELCGCDTYPKYDAPRRDIIQTVRFGNPETLLAFVRGIQAGAPVDSFASPEPWEMPGYDVPVVMAAGAFIQGGSVELSADAPMREPYTAYVQGGLTYESGKIGVMRGIFNILNSRGEK